MEANDPKHDLFRSNTAVLYFRCSDRQEAAEKEAELTAFAEAKGLSPVCVLFDRSDKLPVNLLNIHSLVGDSGIGTLIVQDAESLACGEMSPEAMLFHLKKLGCRCRFKGIKPEKDFTSGLFEVIRDYGSIGGDWFTKKHASCVKPCPSYHGRSRFGYTFEGGYIFPKAPEKELISETFSLFYSGMRREDMLPLLNAKYPSLRINSISRIRDLLLCGSYAGVPDGAGRRYPPIVPLCQWLYAVGKLRFDEEGRHAFVFRSIRCGSRKLLPAYDRKRGAAVYAAVIGKEACCIDAVAVESTMLDTAGELFDFDPDEASLRLSAIACSKKHAYETKAETLLTMLSDIGIDPKRGMNGSDEALSITKAADFDQAAAKKDMLSIELGYCEYQKELFDVSDEALSAFTNHLSRFDSFVSAENEFFAGRLFYAPVLRNGVLHVRSLWHGGKAFACDTEAKEQRADSAVIDFVK